VPSPDEGGKRLSSQAAYLVVAVVGDDEPQVDGLEGLEEDVVELVVLSGSQRSGVVVEVDAAVSTRACPSR
jgi:hypothetical protein